ncbi:Fluoroacetate dehalogenase [Candidatus Kinetoplastibacterium sorsogonicusi]|uniref:Fluoroacetate dehalogenase n=1 Tax=Candidatus Kinetoplastidibacterium kentomonadis TaxID=1576550 RepID=A0A3S7JAH8_9PROT|nr:alpha/beta hydrolase [Candidatus Kinetoplastibacterium sorsogonicusi]AWD32674.1 Fluoroacetate dehalogenase [Candidatus Kinetoplastibacterium sorsogonicusi]
MTISKILIKNYIFHYEKIGSGPPILFIHGSLCDLRYWKLQIKELSNFFSVYTISLRDYWPNNYYHDLDNFSINQHALDLINFIEDVIAQKIFLVGHSRGGSIALKIAINRPDLLNKLIIAEPKLVNKFYNFDQNDNVISIASRLIQNGNINAGLSYFIDHVSGCKIWHKMSSWFKSMAIDNANTIIKQNKEQKYYIDHIDLLKIKIPILLINGELSPNIYFKTIQYLNNTLFNSNSITIHGSSHGMNIDNAKEFNKIVYNFCCMKNII